MLSITIVGEEFFDEATDEFVTRGDVHLELEHSLVSLSKWESKYEKPFLGKDEKSTAEVLDYVSMMILTEDFDPGIINKLGNKNLETIQKYIASKQTATWFSEPKHQPKGRSQETVTAELIYFWMISHTIPFQCETWHINRLLTLIKVCSAKNASSKKKMSKSELAARNRELNAQRKAEYGTNG